MTSEIEEDCCYSYEEQFHYYFTTIIDDDFYMDVLEHLSSHYIFVSAIPYTNLKTNNIVDFFSRLIQYLNVVLTLETILILCNEIITHYTFRNEYPLTTQIYTKIPKEILEHFFTFDKGTIEYFYNGKFYGYIQERYRI